MLIKTTNTMRKITIVIEEPRTYVSVEETPIDTEIQPVTLEFSVYDSEITEGETVILTWSTQNATTITLNGNPVSASGSLEVTPEQSQDYTLVASNSDYEESSTLSITVSPIAEPTLDGILEIGQSNMEGRSGDTTNADYPFESANGYWFDGITQLSITTDRGDAQDGSHANYFAEQYFQLTGNKAVMMEAARGGTPITDASSPNWTEGSSLRGVAEILAGQFQTTYGKPIKYALWCQGESDAVDMDQGQKTKAEVKAAMQDVINWFQTNFPDVPFIISETGINGDGIDTQGWSDMRAIQNEIEQENYNVFIGFSRAKEFASEGLMIDDYHYSYVGLQEMGEAFADCIADLESGSMQLPPVLDLAFSDVTSNSLTVSCKDDIKAETYIFERATLPDFSDAIEVYNGYDNSFQDTGLTESSIYFYRVKKSSMEYDDSDYSEIQAYTTGSGAVEEPIVWTEFVGTALNGDNLIISNPASTSWGNGAIATKAINGSNSIKWEVPALGTDTRQFVGVTNTYNGIANDDYGTLIFSAYVNTINKQVYVFENGDSTFTSSPMTEQPSMEMVFDEANNEIRLEVNGEVIYASPNDFSVPLNVVAIMDGTRTGSSIIGAKFTNSGNLIPKTI